MEATTPGDNRTGVAVSPKNVDLMMDAVRDLSPPIPICTSQMDAERQTYIVEADAVGSIPPTQKSAKTQQSAKKSPGKRKSNGKKAPGRRKASGDDVQLSLLLDKLGERIAFERTGTRLYSALIAKYQALASSGQDPFAGLVQEFEESEDSADLAADDETDETSETRQSDAPLETLQQIRLEELAHFRMLTDCVKDLGGDPTAQTPCADVTAAASLGLMQVLTDPRTTFAQCLNTMLTAELTDNAGWELLAELAEGAGRMQLVEPFTAALEAEQRHLAIVQAWLRNLLTNAAATAAV